MHHYKTAPFALHINIRCNKDKHLRLVDVTGSLELLQEVDKKLLVPLQLVVITARQRDDVSDLVQRRNTACERRSGGK